MAILDTDAQMVLNKIAEVADDFAAERSERQLRRELHEEDFDRIRETGFLLTGVRASEGGIWEDVSHSTRPICEMLRNLAHGDSSVALVSAMHPAVISFWLASPQASGEYRDAWEEQKHWIASTAWDGAWWGTITSEPGSGGDITKTSSVAKPVDPSSGEYSLTGLKHFGSGSGIMSYMITTAVPEGETGPDLFFMNVEDVPWDGSTGMKMIAPWDGHGMTATQSHSMSFEDFPMTRIAWPRNLPKLGESANVFINSLFTSVVFGIAETAVELAREQIEKRNGSLRSYETTEWTRVEMDAWLMQQAYDGMLNRVESEENSLRDSLLAQTTIAELAESVTRRICRVLGGGTYSRHNPFGFWFEDVRALGFLRPPWALAYDSILKLSLESVE